MSEERVEAIRGVYEHFNRTHLPPYELLDSKVEWHTAADLPDSATYRGHHGVEELFSEWVSYFGGDFRADIQEIFDAGDYVVVWCILHGEVRETGGANVELPEAHIWKFREGKVVEVQEYRTKAEALEAAGLSE
jgi:ketosteroid isomerase-like protein